jgi:DNA-directed RNA polymerase subunit RPC12/RpoP
MLEKDNLDFSQSVKCPFCGGRVLIKIRPEIPKKVEAK